jgi:antitoxin HicB
MSDESQMVKAGIAGQLAEAMRDRGISKNRMAATLGTSRTQVDRLLSAEDDITLGSLARAATVVGRRVRIELVDGAVGAERKAGARQSHASRDEAASHPSTSSGQAVGHPEVEVAEEFGWLG